MSENLNLIGYLSEFKELKNIDREVLMKILEDVFKQMLLKKYGADANINVIVNPDKGDIEFQRWRTIVEDGELTNEANQIELSEAIKIEPDFEVGEELWENISHAEFGRRDILALRQSLSAKITEYNKEEVYKKYENRIGEIVTGTVVHVYKKDISFIDEEGIEILIRRQELIPSDFYRKGDSIKAVVIKVELKVNSSLIEASRTSPRFLERLMEEDIPEIGDGTIEIKNIVRVPGEKAKVAVETYDDNVDPVGSCVGMKGSRIHGIMRELRDENIDIISYTTNPELYITRALNPAKISKLTVNVKEKRAEALMEPKQISLAIGKNGVNIRLANKLTGYEIDVLRDDLQIVDDVKIEQFADEIDEWIIDVLKSIGCDTGRNVLDLGREELLRRTDLEEETIDDVLRIINAEFAEE